MRLSIAEARAAGIRLPAVPRRARARKPVPPDSWKPHACVLLPIDPARVSGYGILHSGKLLVSGASSDDLVFRHVVEQAKAEAVERGLPLIVVAETWTAGRDGRDARMRIQTVLGLGAAWQRWASALSEVGIPKSRILRVNMMSWRAKVLGGPMARTTAEWKALACRFVRARFGLETVTDDEAEALCIGVWASHAGRVGAAIRRAGRRVP